MENLENDGHQYFSFQEYIFKIIEMYKPIGNKEDEQGIWYMRQGSSQRVQTYR